MARVSPTRLMDQQRHQVEAVVWRRTRGRPGRMMIKEARSLAALFDSHKPDRLNMYH